jgi:4-hydroxy-3-polyprenylbenzoate decarboxylase
VVFIEHGKHGDVIRRKYWERGKHCPMIVTVGQSPVLGAVAPSTPGPGVGEYDIAGSRLGRAVDVIRGRHTGIPFPADAEIVFEGFMPSPEEVAVPEGPFGEWPGYYASSTRPEPVLQVKAIYHRDDPIIVGAPPMKPTLPAFQQGTSGSSYFRAATLWDELEAAGVPAIKGVWKMAGGGPRFINVIAIEQQHAGHAKMAGLVAAGCGSNAYLGRITIVVDDDIDITNTAEVMWALATRWDPKTQTDIIDGAWTGYIDPTLPPGAREAGGLTNSRIIIYAVRPFHWRDEFPKVNMVDPEYAEQVKRKWTNKLAFLQRLEARR